MPNVLAPQQVQEAFIAAAPLISDRIQEKSIQFPRWTSDIPNIKVWENGVGTQMQELTMKAQYPQIERGFDQWQKIENTQGCNPCDGPKCMYNWTTFGGYGLSRKMIDLMKRDFRSPEYCIEEIQHTREFEQVFDKIVDYMYANIEFFKEYNIGHNFLTSLAKKMVVDSGGAKFNRTNPYVYPNVSTARLSTLNLNMLEFLYERMRLMTDVIPYDVVDGNPVFAVLASQQLLSRLYLDNNEVRQDLRFSGYANDLVNKYNFMSSIRGMFIAAPILTPRRFVIVAGEPVEVLPFVNGIPAEVGSFTDLNPEYEAATHEEVLVHGKHPYSLYINKTPETLGNGTSFGPSFSMMEQLAWVNPLTKEDPARQSGYFFTRARLGLSQQFSEGIFSILVERPPVTLMAMYTPNPVCPVAPPVCTNVIPASDCPCPTVLGMQADPFVANQYIFTFATAVTGEAEDEVVLELDSGLPLTGEIVQVSADGKTVSILFAEELDSGICTRIIGVYCVNSLACSALVQEASDCRSAAINAVSLRLSNGIRAVTAGDVITAYFGDCTAFNLAVVSVDAENLVWVVRYAAGNGPTDNPTGAGSPTISLSYDMICDRGGILSVCVPPSTDAVCPACTPSLVVCS